MIVRLGGHSVFVAFTAALRLESFFFSYETQIHNVSSTAVARFLGLHYLRPFSSGISACLF